MKGDIVGAASGKNHILTGNPKTLICGKFSPKGWLEAWPEGEMCERCSGKYVVPPESDPYATENAIAGRAIGAPLPKPPHDEHLAYLHDKRTWRDGSAFEQRDYRRRNAGSKNV